MFLFRIGGIYAIQYNLWKKNFKVIAFIFFGNPLVSKVHALNLAAVELTSVDRAKLVHTIVRLSKVPNSSIYDGKLLYRIFLTYLRPQVRKCYRTYFGNQIIRASLINYGLNPPEAYSPDDMKVYDPQLYFNAKREWLVRIMDIYSRRGVDFDKVRASLAQVDAKLAVSDVASRTIPTETPMEPEPEVETPEEATPEEGTE